MRVAVLSSTRWDSPWLSKQHLAVALAERGHDVLYVDPPVSPGSLWRHRDRWRELAGGVRSSGGVRVWRPRVAPGQESAAGQRVNARIVGRGVARYLGRPDLTLAFGLTARSVLALSGGRRIYHCTDAWADHPGLPAGRARAGEEAIVRASDLVTACSRPLVDDLRRLRPDVAYLPHGSDHAAFAGAVPDAEIAALPRPIVGYAGGLNFRLDPALLAAARHAVGPGTLVVVGGSWRSARGEAAASVAELLRGPGVVAVGHRPPAELPAVVAAFDVGIVPYVASPFNRKSFPLKVPQYLAAGLPVVSTANGATDHYADVVTVAEGPAGFAAAVADAVRSSDDHEAAERRRRAAARSWTDVADELLALVAAR